MRRVAAVIGSPIGHTLSPALHDAGFAAIGIDAVMLGFEVAPVDLGAAVAGMRGLGFLGASVTVPHKCAVLDHCDRVDPMAAAIGAVNCLVFEPDAVVGYNTDAAGFVDGLVADRESVELDGQRAVILGSGGAARAVTAGLVAAGVTVEIVARTTARATWAEVPVRGWDQLSAALVDCDLLVDCTSAELADPSGWAASLPLDRLPRSAAVASLLYHRQPTLVAAARKLGLHTIDGAAMLVHQAARAFTLWTGQPAPVMVMARALHAARGF